MNHDTDPFVFPDMPDAAVAACNEFLESLYTDFQNHYYAQLHGWYQQRDQRRRDSVTLPLPIDDPPF